MGLQFAPTPVTEQAAVIQFLSDVFCSSPELNSFQPRVFEWKYFDAHPEWSQPRSFSLKKEKQIVAHGGIWPIRLHAQGTELQAINLIDWAASTDALGAGVHVLRSISLMCDVMVTIGGSDDTQKILPKLKYQSGGTLRRYVRVARPWLQLRTRNYHDWKSPARLIRNSLAFLKPLPKIPKACRVEKVSQFGSETETDLRTPDSSQQAFPIRTPANLNFMLTCPASDFAAFVVREGATSVGYFVLSRVGRQVRIVDFCAYRDDPALWAAICAAAVDTACQPSESVEIVAGTSSGDIGRIFEQLGFRLCREDEILFYDRRNLLAPGTQLQLNLIDSDFSFMYNPMYPYLS